MKMTLKNIRPYSELYLNPNCDLHRLLFIKLAENEEYSFTSLVDSYMQTSEIREKQDIGNWSALNKGYKQLYNSIDFTKCKPKDNKIYDDVLVHWIADIYVIFQWTYSLSSKEINKRIPTEKLIELFSPLHEASYNNACEKLYNRFFKDAE